MVVAVAAVESLLPLSPPGCGDVGLLPLGDGPHLSSMTVVAVVCRPSLSPLRLLGDVGCGGGGPPCPPLLNDGGGGFLRLVAVAGCVPIPFLEGGRQSWSVKKKRPPNAAQNPKRSAKLATWCFKNVNAQTKRNAPAQRETPNAARSSRPGGFKKVRAN